MSKKAFFQALESVSDNTINKQWKPQTDNGIKSMTPFMAILGYKLHTNYEYTKKVLSFLGDSERIEKETGRIYRK